MVTSLKSGKVAKLSKSVSSVEKKPLVLPFGALGQSNFSCPVYTIEEADKLLAPLSVLLAIPDDVYRLQVVVSSRQDEAKRVPESEVLRVLLAEMRVPANMPAAKSERIEAFSVKQVAQIVGLTEDSVKAHIKAGKLATFQSGMGHQRITRRELLRMAQELGFDTSKTFG